MIHVKIKEFKFTDTIEYTISINPTIVRQYEFRCTQYTNIKDKLIWRSKGINKLFGFETYLLITFMHKFVAIK